MKTIAQKGIAKKRREEQTHTHMLTQKFCSMCVILQAVGYTNEACFLFRRCVCVCVRRNETM